jgi:hypothetical protein
MSRGDLVLTEFLKNPQDGCMGVSARTVLNCCQRRLVSRNQGGQAFMTHGFQLSTPNTRLHPYKDNPPEIVLHRCLLHRFHL